MNKIGIIGLGWLGEPLAIELKSIGYETFGTVTSPEKKNRIQELGIHVENIQFPDEVEKLSLLSVSTWSHLIFTIPPTKWNNQGEKIHSEIIQHISPNCLVIFISSTGIYTNQNGNIDENASIQEDHPLAKMEQFLQNQLTDRLTILRFAGLVGPNRNPGKFLAGKSNVPNGNHCVNMIHLKDCISLLTKMIENPNSITGIFHAAHDYHPTRKDYFTQKAIEQNLIPPSFLDDNSLSGKIICTDKIKQTFNFQFLTDI